jgi:hypothetical protein
MYNDDDAVSRGVDGGFGIERTTFMPTERSIVGGVTPVLTEEYE